MKHYYVVYKTYQQPGTKIFEIDADNKAIAKALFLEANIKHDYVIKVFR